MEFRARTNLTRTLFWHLIFKLSDTLFIPQNTIFKNTDKGFLLNFMPVLYKYLTKEIIKFSCIVSGGVICIYLAVDFFERIDDFMEAGISLSRAFIYFIFKIPFIITQTLPVCLLLSILIVLCLMLKHNEITALKSCGVSTLNILKPVIMLGFFFTLLLFFLSDRVVPATSVNSNRIWIKEVKKKNAVVSREKNIWIRGTHSIIHIKHYDPAEKTIFGVTICEFDKDFVLIRRIDAKKAVYADDNWLFYDIMELNLDKTEKNYEVIFFDKRVEKFEFLPDDIQRVVKQSEDMSFSELYDYIKKIEAEGYDAGRYRVDLFAKTAFPVICLILSLIGPGIALNRTIKGGMPVKISMGIGIIFFYWMFYSFCISLGYGNIIPPMLAVWTANIIFLCLGVVLLLNTE